MDVVTKTKNDPYMTLRKTTCFNYSGFGYLWNPGIRWVMGTKKHESWGEWRGENAEPWSHRSRTRERGHQCHRPRQCELPLQPHRLICLPFFYVYIFSFSFSFQLSTQHTRDFHTRYFEYRSLLPDVTSLCISTVHIPQLLFAIILLVR